MNEPWEVVHTVDDWYDGPRGGVAEYNGSPHYYRSVYLDTPKWDPDEDRFELTPLSPSAVGVALELSAIFQRWYSAYRVGAVAGDPEDERVLPVDRARRDELERLLASERAASANRTFLVRGEFELGGNRVRWRPLA